jgi:MscS family membrane protein
MKRRFKPSQFLSVWVAFFAAILVWCVWSTAVAQETNAVPDTSTNAPSQVAVLVDRVVGRDFIESHKGELSFGLNRIEFLKPRLLGVPRWQYLASFIYVVLAFYVSKIIDWIIKDRLKAWAKKTETQWDDMLVSMADGPVKMVGFVVLFHIGLQIFEWPDWLERNLSRLTMILVAVALVMVCLRTVDFIVAAWQRQPKPDSDVAFNRQFLHLMGRLMKSTLIVVAGLTLLGNLGVDITALLGSVSVLGLALGLAAQDTVSNIFGTVAVFVDKPFKVGDRIKIGSEVDGFVEEMGLRATRVRNLDGFVITVPNKAVGNNTVTNISGRRTIRAVLNYGLSHETPAARMQLATDIIREILTKHPLTTDFIISFNRFDASALNIEVIYICNTTDWKQFTGALQQINIAIKERFDAEKLDFGLPVQRVFVKSLPPPPEPAAIS